MAEMATTCECFVHKYKPYLKFGTIKAPVEKGNLEAIHSVLTGNGVLMFENGKHDVLIELNKAVHSACEHPRFSSVCSNLEKMKVVVTLDLSSVWWDEDRVINISKVQSKAIKLWAPR